ncbi:hypothetical protein MIND_01304100 [Mycena indigotica]|uniref:Uncharacterized protein n=1 Tax=Mycena indigotica TaxID=2126181 RepID=A0A8H6VR39_9AGAR|nr:uncharacterized protein MIND_01304100 [Mycena indigotica]KAF7290639.1 hypothetical protein MIND_01304100 [Mycena indigotica]
MGDEVDLPTFLGNLADDVKRGHSVCFRRVAAGNKACLRAALTPNTFNTLIKHLPALSTAPNHAQHVPYVTPTHPSNLVAHSSNHTTNSILIPNTSTNPSPIAIYSPITTIYLRDDGRCPKCYRSITPAAWSKHLDGQRCRDGADAIAAKELVETTANLLPSLPHQPQEPPPNCYNCAGFILDWEIGDFWATYPHQIHATTSPPVDFYIELRGSPCARSTSCAGLVSIPGQRCNFCADLPSKLKTIQDRAAKTHDHVRSTQDLSWLQLRNKLAQRDADFNALKLKYQNCKDSLDVARTRVGHFTALLHFLQTTPVPALHRLLAQAGTEKWSTEKTLKRCQMAVDGKYRPTNFFGWEIDLGMIVYELGGLSAVHSFSKSVYALPSRKTLQKYRREKDLQPAIFGPDFTPTYNNVATHFGGAPPTRRYLHTASFDEIAKSPTVDYISELDAMGGLCLEHLFHLPDARIGETITPIEIAARLVKEGKVHIADLISVGAISRLARDNYGAKPVYIGSSCKLGDWRDVLRVVQNVLEAWSRSPDGEVKHGPITAVASDGDPKRRIAFFVLCMQNEVKEGNPIYEFVKDLYGLNLFTGKNNLTMDFDFKHEVKRICTTIRSPQGIAIKGICINRDLLLIWLAEIPGYDWSEVSIHALLNPPDAQDVPRAIKLLLAIIDIQKIDKASLDATQQAEYEALCLFGEMLDALLQPFINTTLTLTHQACYLSKFSFLLCAIYLQHGTSFIPNQLYGDLQAMVKNAIFLIAKTRAFDPDLEVFFCLLGDDVLETLFGRIRMVGGHHPNCGLAEFCARGRSAMNLDDIFSRNPHLERKPERLNFFRMQHVDHLGPAQWKTELRAKSCDLRSCWEWAATEAEATLAKYSTKLTIREQGRDISLTFRELFQRDKTDLLRPRGGKYPSISGAVDRSLGDASTTDTADIDLSGAAYKFTDPFAGLTTADILAREAKLPLNPPHLCSAFARIDNTSERRIHKSSAVRILFDMYHDFVEAHDRLSRVRGFTAGGTLSWARDSSEGAVVLSAATHFQLGQLFVTLVSHNGVDIGLAVVKTTLIKDGRSGKAKSISAIPLGELHLSDSSYIISGQVLSLVAVPPGRDTGDTWSWAWDQGFVSLSLLKKATATDSVSRVGNLQISVCSRLVQPFSDYAHEIMTENLSIAMRATREKTWYFSHADLCNAWESIWQRIEADHSLHNKISRFTKVIDGHFPYSIRSSSVSSAFAFSLPAADTAVCNSFLDKTECGICAATVKHEKRQLHIGQHILKHRLSVPDGAVKTAISAPYPCGFCGGDGLVCKISIDSGKAQSDCRDHYPFLVSAISKVTNANPCTNIPVSCPFSNCGQVHWKYNIIQHLNDRHPTWRDIIRADSKLIPALTVSREEQLALDIPLNHITEWPISCQGSYPPTTLSPSNPTKTRLRDKENLDPNTSILRPSKRQRLD